MCLPGRAYSYSDPARALPSRSRLLVIIRTGSISFYVFHWNERNLRMDWVEECLHFNASVLGKRLYLWHQFNNWRKIVWEVVRLSASSLGVVVVVLLPLNINKDRNNKSRFVIHSNTRTRKPSWTAVALSLFILGKKNRSAGQPPCALGRNLGGLYGISLQWLWQPNLIKTSIVLDRPIAGLLADICSSCCSQPHGYLEVSTATPRWKIRLRRRASRWQKMSAGSVVSASRSSLRSRASMYYYFCPYTNMPLFLNKG